MSRSRRRERRSKKGLIAGAALDVIESEPPAPRLDLGRMNNVILSPRVARHNEEGS